MDVWNAARFLIEELEESKAEIGVKDAIEARIMQASGILMRMTIKMFPRTKYDGEGPTYQIGDRIIQTQMVNMTFEGYVNGVEEKYINGR
jgi:hypothetical protein